MRSRVGLIRKQRGGAEVGSEEDDGKKKDFEEEVDCTPGAGAQVDAPS
jgi:hypothetical protein